MNLSDCWTRIERVVGKHGASRVGAASPRDPHASLFLEWITTGHHAGMKYLEKNTAARIDPSVRFPWLRSVIVIAVPYCAERPTAPPGALSNGIARYAFGEDYHTTLARILREIENEIHELDPDAQTRRYVDTGPLSDRALGAAGGLGWIGKNGMLIDPEHGSYFFIGTLLTSIDNDLEFDEVTDRCGACTRCIDACPTDAILSNRTLDSGACISYLTIEHRGEIPSHFAGRLGGNVFGCDICQEACPWNADPLASHPDFELRERYRATPVSDLLGQTQEDFSRFFRGSAIKRAKWSGMTRNASLAQGHRR